MEVESNTEEAYGHGFLRPTGVVDRSTLTKALTGTRESLSVPTRMEVWRNNWINQEEAE